MKCRICSMTAVFIICIAVLSIYCAAREQNAIDENRGTPAIEATVRISMDTPVYTSFKQMEEQADIIVVGQYTADYVEYENDIQLGEDHKSVSRRYSFKISSVLKGDDLADIIEIVKPVSMPFDFYSSDDKESYVIQVPYADFNIPITTQKYIIFGKYVSAKKAYRAIGQPWEIMVDENNILSFNSSKFKGMQTEPTYIPLKTDTSLYEIRIEGEKGVHDDFVTGKTLSELINEISN